MGYKQKYNFHVPEACVMFPLLFRVEDVTLTYW